MENLYAIYSYKFIKTNDEGDWLQPKTGSISCLVRLEPYFLFKRVRAILRRNIPVRYMVTTIG